MSKPQRLKRIVAKAMNSSASDTVGMSGNAITDPDLMVEFPSGLTLEEKVSYLLDKMTLEEKIDMMNGEKSLGITGVPRLNIPRVWCTDATSGARCYGRATAFPTAISMTSTWNRKLMYEAGAAIADEARAKGVSILLAPGVNICRVPTNGRNFEYMGEDPYLASQLVVPYIKGVQDNGVITTVKHFVCNNSDYDRHRMNSIVDERTLREIYFPAFKAAITKGNSRGIMNSYNLVNGIHASENNFLLTDVLRKEWKFDGFVISDWNATYSTKGSLEAGMDLEMPKPKHYTEKKIKKLLENGEINESLIDERVTSLLRPFIEFGIFERTIKDLTKNEYSDEHDKLALKIAREGVVLLKNESQLLPFNRGKTLKIAVLGPNAKKTPTSGGGSCYVNPYESKGIYQALFDLSDTQLEVSYYPTKKDKIDQNAFGSVKSADAVLLAVGYTEVEDSECWDRSWELPKSQVKLIHDVANLNPNTVVVINAGGGLETESWVHRVPTVLHSFYLGQSAGTIIAEILLGITTPSGKLPISLAKRWSDIEATKNYVKNPSRTSPMQVAGGRRETGKQKILDQNYAEKLMIGYRHFDTNNIDPQFPFGHGLSYTTFEYSNLKITTDVLTPEKSITVSVDVKNTGDRDGSEIVQLYIADKQSKYERPTKELKGFGKTALLPGETKTVHIEVDFDAFKYFDPVEKCWIAEPGEFILMIGKSSRDIVFQKTISL